MITMAYKMRNIHLLQNATALMAICVSCNKILGFPTLTSDVFLNQKTLIKKCVVILLLRTVRGVKTSTTPISNKS